MIICVTGQSGSGKSTLAKLIAENKNYFYIDVDDIVHKMYNDKTMMQKYIDTFGEIIIGKDKKVDREKVRTIALKDKDSFNKLNAITWGYIENKIDSYIKKYNNVVIDYKFLPITKYFNDENIKILVSSDEKRRKEMIIKRDGITEKELMIREKHSPNFDEYKYDYVINNDYTDKINKNILKI